MSDLYGSIQSLPYEDVIDLAAFFCFHPRGDAAANKYGRHLDMLGRSAAIFWFFDRAETRDTVALSRVLSNYDNKFVAERCVKFLKEKECLPKDFIYSLACLPVRISGLSNDLQDCFIEAGVHLAFTNRLWALTRLSIGEPTAPDWAGLAVAALRRYVLAHVE